VAAASFAMSWPGLSAISVTDRVCDLRGNFSHYFRGNSSPLFPWQFFSAISVARSFSDFRGAIFSDFRGRSLSAISVASFTLERKPAPAFGRMRFGDGEKGLRGVR
jgi:hypothetical protein